MFTVRYALSPHTKQTRFVRKGICVYVCDFNVLLVYNNKIEI